MTLVNSEEQEVTKSAGSYLRDVGRDVIADIHVHGILGMFAITAHKLLGEHIGDEKLAIGIMLLILGTSALVWGLRRVARRRREKKSCAQFTWNTRL